jgi:hypothetical protein
MIGSQGSGLWWTVAVIKKLLWDVAWDLWEQCNGSLHDRNYQETLHNMASIDTEIKFQFQQGHDAHLPRRMQYLFDGSIEDLLTTLVRNRQQWLASITAAWAMATERLAQQDQGMAASRQLMHAWLDGHSAGEG